MANAPDELSRQPADDALRTLDERRLFALYTAARSLARAETTDEIHAALLRGAREAGACAEVALYRPESAGTTLSRVAPADAPAGLPQQITLAAPWARATPRLLLAPSDALGSGTQLVAVANKRGLHGALLARWAAGTGPEAGGQAALDALADDAGRALDRVASSPGATFPGETDTQQALLDAVGSMTDIGLLYSNLMDRLLNAILEQILAALRLGGGALYLYNEPVERVELAVWARGPESAYGHDPGLLWDGPLLAEALAQAREAAQDGYSSQAIKSLRQDEQPGHPLSAALLTLGAANLVSAPILAGGWLIGVMQVVAAPGCEVTEGQIRLLRLLGRQAAAAIENARLFAQTRADQERARAVVDATNDAILMIDEHRRPMIVNRRARFFFGLTERDLVGKSFDQLGNLFARIFEDGQRFNGWLGQMLRSQSERAVDEFRILSPETRLLQCYTAPVTDLHDRYLGRLLVFRDITREREVERMKSDFVSIVSHELRTPLTSIQGALQLVLGQPENGRPGLAEGLSQRGRELLSISRSNTERLIRLINDILDIAKIEQGRIELRREQLSPEELCRLAAAEMSALANSRGISVELQVRQWLPTVLADRDRSVQVLVNLLSNAIKFSQPGQRVVLGARSDGGMVCFTVQDWGRGIAPEHQSGLFQKFQQIDSSSTRDVGGTGLGLAISKALVEELGGRMWLDSRLGEGSTFSFTLPVAPSVGADGGPQRPRVLVADASGELRAELSTALAAAGWEPHQAASAEALLTQYAALAPALVVVGWPLGERDDELLRNLVPPGGDGTPLLLLSDEPPAGLPPGLAVAPRATPAAEVAARASRLRIDQRTHVLVVDDDPHVRPVLVRLLQRHGLRVSNASDGYGALAAVEADRPNVVLLDIKMPGLDGLEVLRRLKGRPETAQIPVIILTANDLGDMTRLSGRELGAHAYLEKPIAYERLISTVYGAIGISERAP